jgi:cytochrome c biogenesis protein CcmG/thiol:disulfide interchange protein DsbE
MSTAKKQAGSGRLTWYIGASIAVLIVGFLVYAISRNSGDDSSSAAGLQEYGEVTVSGDALPAYSEGADDPAVGKMAPEVAGEGFTGNAVTTKTDAPQMIVFLAHWCPHCQAEVPQLVEWERDGEVPAGLEVMAVATATSPTNPNFPPSEWLTRENFPLIWPVMVDDGANSAGNAFGVSGYPFFVLTDSEGKVVYRGSGEISKDDLTSIIKTTLGL